MGIQYDLVVIGGGAGGLVSAVGAAQLGARVAIVEKEKLGGDCLNYGCVPSKGLIRSARLAGAARRMAEFGIEVGEIRVDFPRVIQRMKAAQAQIAKHDASERFEAMGIEVIFGAGRFTDSETFEVGGRSLKAKKYLLSTGSAPFVPPIPGLDAVPYLTNETIFDLEALPRRLVVIGAGPIGIEMAQAFQRFGSEVDVLELAPRLLPRLDDEMASVLAGALQDSGLRLHFEARTERVEHKGGEFLIHADTADGKRTFACDALLVAIGRSPNVNGLGLEAAGVKVERGVVTDNRLQTTNSRIYAVGDVRGHYQFTHMAEYEAGIALRNMLFSAPFGIPVPFLKARAEYHAVPWTIYTSPEAAHVGMSEKEAREALGAGGYQVFRFPMDHVDRAIIDGETEGFCKVITDAKGRVVGADLVGPSAGDILHEYVLAVRKRMHIKEVVRTIHIYPTLAQVNKRVAGQYYTEKLFTPKTRRRFQWLFGLRGNIEVTDPMAVKPPRVSSAPPRVSSAPPRVSSAPEGEDSSSGRAARASGTRTSGKGAVLKLAAVLGVLAAAGLALWQGGYLANFTVDQLTAAIRSFGALAPVVFILTYAVATVFLFPGSVLTITGGLVFGPVFGMLFNVVGATLGATGAFLVARFGGREMIERFLRGKFKALDAKAGQNGFLLIFYLRLIPAVPFNVLNFGSGLSPIRLKDYVLATVLGILPGTFAYTYLGDAVGELLGGRFSSQVWVALGVFAAAALLPTLLKRVLPKPGTA